MRRYDLRMSPAVVRALAGLIQPLKRECACRLQQTVALGLARLKSNERPIYQCAQCLQGFPLVQQWIARNPPRHRQRKSSDEHSQPSKDRLLWQVQQSVAPFKCCAQSLLALWRIATPSRKQSKPLAEPCCQRGDTKMRNASGSQLDRQCQAVKLPANFDDHGDVE